MAPPLLRTFDAPGDSGECLGPWMEGSYRCEYVRPDGQWKFSRPWFRTVAPDPYADEKLKELRSRHSKPPASEA
jgi:hypothetical protein